MSSNSILSSLFQRGRIPKVDQLNIIEASVYWTFCVECYEEICLRFNFNTEERLKATTVE